jgi:hypothetical protein
MTTPNYPYLHLHVFTEQNKPFVFDLCRTFALTVRIGTVSVAVDVSFLIDISVRSLSRIYLLLFGRSAGSLGSDFFGRYIHV